jgi:hypothetical protein
MASFAATVSHAAWHDKRSWAVIATEDQSFDQAMLVHMAERAGAPITFVPGSHALFMTQAGTVAEVVRTASQEAGALVH